MAANWNQAGNWLQGDFNNDGFISIGDLSMMAANWNWELPATGNIPEPTTLALLACAALGFLRRRA